MGYSGCGVKHGGFVTNNCYGLEGRFGSIYLVSLDQKMPNLTMFKHSIFNNDGASSHIASKVGIVVTSC